MESDILCLACNLSDNDSDQRSWSDAYLIFSAEQGFPSHKHILQQTEKRMWSGGSHGDGVAIEAKVIWCKEAMPLKFPGIY